MHAGMYVFMCGCTKEMLSPLSWSDLLLSTLVYFTLFYSSLLNCLGMVVRSMNA